MSLWVPASCSLGCVPRGGTLGSPGNPPRSVKISLASAPFYISWCLARPSAPTVSLPSTVCLEDGPGDPFDFPVGSATG